MQRNSRVLIVGGVACGPKAASRLKRLCPYYEVTMIDKGNQVSYGACGLPYYVEGIFPDVDMLMETPVGVTRNVPFFEKVKGFRTLTRMEAIRIDRERKVMRVRNLDSGLEEELPYDKLVLATGSRPIVPPIPGLELQNVWYMRRPDDADSMVREIEANGHKNAVLIGAGYIGIEMAEALQRRGLNVTLVEMFDRILPQFLDPEMAMLAEKHLVQKKNCPGPGRAGTRSGGQREGCCGSDGQTDHPRGPGSGWNGRSSQRRAGTGSRPCLRSQGWHPG